MKLEHIVKAIEEIIYRETETRGLTVTNKGTGKAFEGSFWEGILIDESDIPNIVAANENYEIELRSFWGRPEVDVRFTEPDFSQRLLVLDFSDGVYREKTREDVITASDLLKIEEKEPIRYYKGDRDTTQVVIGNYPKKITLPKSYYKIGETAFDRCSYLASMLNYNSEYLGLKQYFCEHYHLKEFYHNGDFQVNEVRSDSRGKYAECTEMLYQMIDEIEERCKELEKEESKGKDSIERE